MKTLGFDLDGVLYPWQEVTYSYIKSNSDNHIEPYNNFWNTFDDKYPRIYIDNLLELPMLYSCRVPDKNDLKILDTLNRHYYIIYITARMREVEWTTRKYLEGYSYPNPKEVYFTDDKHIEIIKHEVDYFVEDRPKYLNQIKGLTEVILMKQPYNRDYWDEFPSINKLDELPELLEILNA